MVRGSARQRVGTTALTRTHFLLLYAAMLVAASGNTALQSVMPAIGREIGISDFWVAVAYTWSAVLWVALAPFWAEKSDHHGRKALTLLGLTGFIVSTILCGTVLHLGLVGAIGGGLTFILFGIFRAIYGALGSSTPSATQAYLAAKTRRSGRVAALSALSSSFGLGTIIGPAVAPLFVLPVVGLAGPMFAFALIALTVLVAVLLWLPNDRYARRIGRGAAMSYPSGASQPTGASVVAATSPKGKRLSWKDARVRPWILAGVTAGHAQAATLTCIGFFVIDRLALEPHGSEASIAIVMMAGASATLAAQWGLIPRLGHEATGPDPVGSAGRGGRPCRSDRRSRPLRDHSCPSRWRRSGSGSPVPASPAARRWPSRSPSKAALRALITAANGISWVAAPALGMALYLVSPNLPFAISSAPARRACGLGATQAARALGRRTLAVPAA